MQLTDIFVRCRAALLATVHGLDFRHSKVCELTLMRTYWVIETYCRLESGWSASGWSAASIAD